MVVNAQQVSKKEHSIFFQSSSFIPKDAGVAHGFFGRRGGVSTGIYSSLNCGAGSNDNPAHIKKNREIVKEELNISAAKLLSLSQIHSSICLIVDKSWEEYERKEADGFVTDLPNVALGILTADCAPVLFYGQKKDGKPVIGAAHAGWKGAVGGILKATVQEMIALGAEPDTLRATVGPTIGVESYEVGPEFKSNFEEKDVTYSNYFLNNGQSLFFNLPQFCEDELKAAGVAKVFVKNLDTFFHEDDFFSYRRATHRQDNDYGRQISVIAINAS